MLCGTLQGCAKQAEQSTSGSGHQQYAEAADLSDSGSQAGCSDTDSEDEGFGSVSEHGDGSAALADLGHDEEQAQTSALQPQGCTGLDPGAVTALLQPLDLDPHAQVVRKAVSSLRELANEQGVPWSSMTAFIDAHRREVRGVHHFIFYSRLHDPWQLTQKVRLVRLLRSGKRLPEDQISKLAVLVDVHPALPGDNAAHILQLGYTCFRGCEALVDYVLQHIPLVSHRICLTPCLLEWQATQHTGLLA